MGDYDYDYDYNKGDCRAKGLEPVICKKKK